MGFIYWMSSRARPEAFDDTPDLWLHGGAYFVLAVLGVRALGRGVGTRAPSAAVWGGVAIAVLYGASDEWHQSMVASRVGSLEDVFYDTVGALAAAVALGLIWWVREKGVET